MNVFIRMNENMEFPDMSGDDIEWLQDSFVKVIFGRIEESLANRRLKKEDAGKVNQLFDVMKHPHKSIICPRSQPPSPFVEHACAAV